MDQAHICNMDIDYAQVLEVDQICDEFSGKILAWDYLLQDETDRDLESRYEASWWVYFFFLDSVQRHKKLMCTCSYLSIQNDGKLL